MGVGRGGKKVPVTSGLKGGRRVPPEYASAQGSKAQKASAPPREEALDDDDPMQDVKSSVQSNGMTWRMLIPSEQGLRAISRGAGSTLARC